MTTKAETRSNFPGWLTLVLGGATFAALSFAESGRPLRRRVEPTARHRVRNLTVAAITAAVTAAIQIPLLAPVARRTEEGRLGLLHRLPMSRAMRIVAGVLLLDYTLWWWHWLNHKLPFFWRFHLVHHVDLDLDASTALRFHFGEMALSVFYRAAQFRLLGIDPLAASLWQASLFISILFHHSNMRLPAKIERRIVPWLVTPRMHGIHHSDVRDETDSNWSSLLSCWDFLHGTFRFDVPQDSITIGVPAWLDREDITLERILTMPFRVSGDIPCDWIDATGQPRLTRVAASAEHT